MKRHFFQIIKLLKETRTATVSITQREISKELGISLAYVNKIVSDMKQAGFLWPEKAAMLSYKSLTPLALKNFKKCKVDNAIIMAAGFGSRFVPLTYATPKGLLKVFGQRMIERQIEQLHKVGITDITIVVGYLKDAFEYLIDKYNVKLVFNPDFKEKNNLSTLYHVRDRLKNTYILSSDNWLRENMYHSHEYDSWYSAVKVTKKTDEWILKTGRYDKITDVKIGGSGGWIMFGPVFFSQEFSETIRPLIEAAYKRNDTDNWYWENVYISNIKNLPPLFANKQCENMVYEFESLDEIRLFDPSYLLSSNNEYIELISKVFNVPENNITNFRPVHFGMTNKSFLFKVEEQNYIFRIPGEGTEILINRKQEYDVYKAISGLSLSDTVVYFDPSSGIKITEYINNAHNANAKDERDVKLCMQAAKKLHSSGIRVAHRFDFRERISYYEKLARGLNGILFQDYTDVRAKMNEILDLLDKTEKMECLTHIDLIPDNVIISGKDFYLID